MNDVRDTLVLFMQMTHPIRIAFRIGLFVIILACIFTLM